MKLSDYPFLYNAAAYFAARERFGGAERAELDALTAATDEKGRRSGEYKAEVDRLQAEISKKDLATLLFEPTAEGYDALCWAIAELTTQGELWRRYMGHEARETLTLERVRTELKPYQIAEARALIMTAIIHGIKPPEDKNAEVDEVLEALQKKTGNR